MTQTAFFFFFSGPSRHRQALRESSQLNNWKPGEMKAGGGGGGGGGGAAVGGLPSVEDGAGNEGSAEKIDPLEVSRDIFLLAIAA